MEQQPVSTPQYGPEIGAQITPRTSAEMALRGLVAQALKRCPKDRQQVASELSTRSGERITKRMLDDWASPSKKGLRFPASLVKDFCEITGDDRLQRWMAGPRLGVLIEFGERVSSAVEFFRIAATLRSCQRRKRTRKKQVRKA